MTKTTAGPILHLIRRVVEDQRFKELPDQELLHRFSTGRDEAAFAALLRRHGSMVLDICRNLLGNEADAEDAFQATFLVLAQRAGAIRKKSSVGSWLHGVAYRTALKARAQFANRQKHEAGAPGHPHATPSDELTWREVQQALHVELNQLSECYQAPLVLCFLEGKTQDEAAMLLGVSRATVKKRLESARALLRLRLVRRGLGPVAVLLASAWPCATASACLPATLMSSTTKAVSMVAAGQATAAVVSANVAALTRGVLKTMFPTKLNIITALLLGFGLVGEGVIALTHLASADDPPPARAAQEVKQRREVIVVTQTAHPKPTATAELLDPAGKSLGELNLGQLRSAYSPRLSPDGKRVAFLTYLDPEVGTGTRWPSFALLVADVDAKVPPSKVLARHVRCPSFAWSVDGKKLYVSNIPREKLRVADNVDQVVPVRTRLYNLTDETDAATETPEGHGVSDVAPDGKSVLTKVQVWDQDAERLTNFVVPLDTMQPVPLGVEGLFEPRFSPDGKQVIGVRRAVSRSPNEGLFVFDLAKKQHTQVPLPKELRGTSMERACWSPDGKRILLQWSEPGMAGPAGGGAPGNQSAMRLSIVGIDGSNLKQIAAYDWGEFISGIDWR